MYMKLSAAAATASAAANDATAAAAAIHHRLPSIFVDDFYSNTGGATGG
jgi:hypothetical protein